MEKENYIEVRFNENVLKQLGYIFKYKNQKKYLIKNGKNVTILDIPATYTYKGKNYKITRIGKKTSSGISSVPLEPGYSLLTSIMIPDTVTEIGDKAFSGYSSLTDIILPNSVTKIGNWAFYDCSSLANITIPNSVKEIGFYAFNDCKSLKSVAISNSVTKIGDCAFGSCNLLINLTIPNSVTEIGNYAFIDCLSLTGIKIPETVKEIGDGAFENIDTIYYNGNAKGSTWGANKVVNNNYNYIEVKLNEIILRQLGYDLEYKNKGELNQKLVYLKKNGKDVTDLVIPSNYNYKGQDYKIVQINYKIFAYCSSLISVTIPDGITEIDCYTFEGCYNLANVIIPNTVTKIGESAFNNCKSLTNIKIPDSIIKIDEEAFCECSSLTNLTIPNSVTEIGDWAFENVPHIEYHGTATGAPWGAKAMN